MIPSSPHLPATEGFILLNKNPGQTSFQALSPLKKVYGRHLGHAGTLDKFAEGLLIILVGKATKLVPWVTGEDKVYEAIFYFGQETATLDPEGPVIAEGAVPKLETILEKIPGFLGPIMQRPPEYSAIHIQGKRAYERVLDGETLDMPSRPISIYQFDFMGGELPELKFRIHCSKGTYIRSLARDLALAAGTFGHVKELKRTQIGPFSLDEVQKTSEGVPSIRTLGDLIAKLRIPVIFSDSVSQIKNGKPLVEILGQTPIESGVFAIFSHQNQFLALGENAGGRLSYRFVL